MPAGPPAEEFKSADAVFVGKVVSIQPRPAQDQFEALRVTLQTERVYRGEVGDRVVVTTAGSSASCGYGFTEGEVYVVYANTQDGALHVSLCSRTAAIGNAGEDLRFLDGQPKLPTQPTLTGSEPGPLNVGMQAVRVGVVGGLSIFGRGS